MDTAVKGTKSVCVVIVNYNGGAILTECVRSVLASTVPVGIVVSDIPLLFENGLADGFDRIVLVDAPRPLRLDRLVRDRGLRETEAMAMIAQQMPADLKRARADFVIDNDGTREALEQRVDDVWRALSAEADRTPRDSLTLAPPRG